MKSKRILVVEDHPVFREGLLRLLSQEKDLHVVGEASSVLEAGKTAESLSPDLVLVDISLEDSNGLDLVRQLRRQSPDVRILVLSMHKEALHAERAMRAGANGYIMKRENGAQLMIAIRQVLSGQTYLSESMKEWFLQKLSVSPKEQSQLPEDLLSDREFEIFQLIGQGYGTRQMADSLHISVKTIESHREHIREKMHLASTFDLVQRAIHWMHTEKEHL